MKLKNKIIFLSAIFGGFWAVQSVAADTTDLFHLQQRWAEVNYQMEGKAQLTAFAQLVEESESLSAKEPSSAEIWIWKGIIKSTYAGAKGGLGALALAKEAKVDLETSVDLDPNALGGSAYTTLGTLYHSVPGWPLGFGDDDTAEELLIKAVNLNPEGIDTNYFYGTYLLDEERYAEAGKILLQAQNAPARPDRPVADSGRQREISEALELLNKKR
ncbi:MAG: tetratricopeptide (TPR) repeat protein [Pseudohongiellaceae bacterium]|jgi:tetratricopeptide (TPR) repeat protein